MSDIVRNGLRAGVVFGVIVLFLILVGFTVPMSDIIGDFLGLDTDLLFGNAGGLLIFFAIIGLIAGAYASRDNRETWKEAGLVGLVEGVTLGVIVGITAALLGILDDAGVEFREYFVQLSRPNIKLLLYGQEPLIGGLINFLIFSISGILGGLIAYGLSRSSIMKNLSAKIRGTGERLSNTEFAQRVRSNPNSAFGAYVLLFIILLLIPLLLGNYWSYTAGTVGIYVLMGLGLNIVVGFAGLLDLGYVAFFAIGAYSVGLLTAPEPLGIQLNFWVALLLAVGFAALSGILLGIPVLRMRGDYLAIVTLGFGEIIRVLARSDILSDFTGGPQGVRDIGGPILFGEEISNRAFLYMIIMGIILLIFLTTRLQHSRVGRAWGAMREDETVAQAQGINTLKSKLLAFAIGAAFAGLGGVLFASRNQYTGPEDHNLLVSINVLCLVIVGGMGSIPGVITGSFVLKGLPEFLRDLDVYRMLVFGALLVVMMIVRPEGIWPAPRRRLELHEEDDAHPPDAL